MSDDWRRLPADLLLLRERRRRLGLAQNESAAALVMESDAIIAEAAQSSVATGAGSITLYRPLDSVMLARIPWSGSVDHELLQSAIACTAAPASHAPALSVSLGPDDAIALEQLAAPSVRSYAPALARAAALPATIVGADATTVGVAASLLAAYRRASLVFAWQTALLGDASEDTAQERDASAVQVVSMLRALLGEI